MKVDKKKYPKGMLLDVGCRDRKQPNFVGIDRRGHPGVDIIHDLEKFPYPIPSESCITIKCAHVIEHIKPWLVFDFMDELWRMLLPDGQLMISAPYGGSIGYWQDPTHCTHIHEGTWFLFDPDHPLYQQYRPKPWKLEHSSWKPGGNIEAIFRKRLDTTDVTGSFALAQKAVSLGAMQKVLELGAMLELLKSKPLDTVMEIGTAAGGVFYALCQLAPKDATLISIDLPTGDYGDGRIHGVGEFRAHVRKGQNAHFIREDSHKPKVKKEVLKILGGRSVDFLLIDGDHTYKGVKKDWEMYSPLVKSGIVVFHDICHHNTIPECRVEDVWREVKSKYSSTELIDPQDTTWGGIGVIFK